MAREACRRTVRSETQASCWSVENSSKLHAVVKADSSSLRLNVKMEIHFLRAAHAVTCMLSCLNHFKTIFLVA